MVLATSTGAVGSGAQEDTSSLGHPADVLDMPVDPNEPTYCLCHQVSYGEMIGCDNTDVSSIYSEFLILFCTTHRKISYFLSTLKYMKIADFLNSFHFYIFKIFLTQILNSSNKYLKVCRKNQKLQKNLRGIYKFC